MSIPSWARGRTHREVLGITEQMAGTLQKFNQAPTVMQQQAPAYQNPGYQNNDAIRDEDFVDGRTFRSGINQAAQQMAPYLQQSIDLAASGNRSIAEQQYGNDFKKYGPEIELELAKLPKQAWTVDNIRTIVKFVRGNHVEEIAEERARQMIASGESSFRSGGASGLPGTQTTQNNPLESEELPAEYRNLMRKQGINRETVREFCRSNNMTEAAWFEMAKNTGSAVITEGARGGPVIERQAGQ